MNKQAHQNKTPQTPKQTNKSNSRKEVQLANNNKSKDIQGEKLVGDMIITRSVRKSVIKRRQTREMGQTRGETKLNKLLLNQAKFLVMP